MQTNPIENHYHCLFTDYPLEVQWPCSKGCSVNSVHSVNSTEYYSLSFVKLKFSAPTSQLLDYSLTNYETIHLDGIHWIVLDSIQPKG